MKAVTGTKHGSKAVSHLKVTGCDWTARVSEYEDETAFVECEFRASVQCGRRKFTWNLWCGQYKRGLPFYTLSKIGKEILSISYQEWRTASRRTGLKGTKAHSDNSHLPTTFANWGLPKSECLKKLCVMRINVINPKAVPREMTLKIWHGNGVLVVVRERDKNVHMAKEDSLSVLKLKLIREEYLNWNQQSRF